jgi:hypothetical protein
MHRKQKTLLLCITGFALLSGWSYSIVSASSNNLLQTDTGFRIELKFVKPQHIGQNQVLIAVWDANQKPVSRAKVELSVEALEETSDHTASTLSSEETSHLDKLEPAAKTPADDMTNMPGMSGMTDQTTTAAANDLHRLQVHAIPTLKPGEYKAQINIVQAGGITVRAQVMALDGNISQAEFPLEIRDDSARYDILAGFFGLNVVVVGIGALLKRKPLEKTKKRGFAHG